MTKIKMEELVAVLKEKSVDVSMYSSGVYSVEVELKDVKFGYEFCGYAFSNDSVMVLIDEDDGCDVETTAYDNTTPNDDELDDLVYDADFHFVDHTDCDYVILIGGDLRYNAFLISVK